MEFHDSLTPDGLRGGGRKLFGKVRVVDRQADRAILA